MSDLPQAIPDQPPGQQAMSAMGIGASPSGVADTSRPTQVAALPQSQGDGAAPSASGGNWETQHFNYGGLRIPGSKVGPQAGGFQAFDSPEAGVAAISQQLDRYAMGQTTGQPLRTLRQIVSTWAPPSENDTNLLIHRAAGVMGVDPDQPLNVADPKTRAKLIEATIRNEQGGKLPVDPAVIQKIASDPTYQPASQEMVDRFNRHAELLNTAMGSFNPQAKALIDASLRQIGQEAPGHQEAMAEAKDMRSFERAAMAKWMADSNRPPKNMHENWEQWGGIAMMFAAIGPLMGKRSARFALDAAGSMLQAANQADQRNYDRAYQQWKDHNDSMLKAIDLFHQQYKEIIDNDKMAWDHKQAEIQTLLTAAGVVSRMDPDALDKQIKATELLRSRSDYAKAQNADAETRLAVEAKDRAWLADPKNAGATQVPPDVHNKNVGDAERERKGTAIGSRHPDQVEVVDKDGKHVRSGLTFTDPSGTLRWSGTGEPVQDTVPEGGSINKQSISQPRSAPAMYLKKYMEENPDATSGELAEASAEFRRLGAVETGFASGILGRQVVSLNTVADHLLLVRRYFEELNNGQIPRANQLANRIATELGKPEVTTFEAGRDIMADEVVRLLTSTGGTERDRTGMQGHLASFMSPQQGAGVLRAFKEFVGGRFEALEQQYAGNDLKRREKFENVLLTPKSREMYQSAKEGAPPTQNSTVPSGIPAGSKKIGTKGGKEVWQAPDGSKWQE